MVHKKLILIADDDEVSYTILDSVINKNTSHKSIRAKNGIEALHHAMVNYRINCVLMDIKMPTMDGYEATKRIKAIRPNLPVIAVSAVSLPEEKDKIIAAGCNDFISKPIDEYELLKKINYFVK